MTAVHSVTVPARAGEPPMLALSLTVDETVNIVRRHLTRMAASGVLRVEFRSHRHDGGRGLTTTIVCTEAEPPAEVSDA